MKLNFKARSWHAWAAIILALPILVVGTTAVFMAHNRALGTREIKVAAGWLPGYRTSAARTKPNEARIILATPAGAMLIGMDEGLYRLEGAKLLAVEEFAGIAVRGLTESGFGRVAATREGIWLETGGRWERVMQGEAWGASLRADGRVVVAMKDKGIFISGDGRKWQPDPLIAAALAAMPTEAADKPLTLRQLVVDLHSGLAVFGADGQWIWIDLIGLDICLLAMTGVYMWWRTEKRKARMAGA